MRSLNPDYRDAVDEIFERAGFVRDLGLRVADAGVGWCESVMELTSRHLQHHGYAHAGVLATVGDHTAGGAGTTLVRIDECVLTAEFKVNFLRPARGRLLRCRSQVLKPGRTLIVVESEVRAEDGTPGPLAAKSTVTLAVVPKPR